MSSARRILTTLGDGRAVEEMPENTMAEAHRWAAEIGGPAYAIDDQTTIKVVDSTVEVVSEGTWTHLPS